MHRRTRRSRHPRQSPEAAEALQKEGALLDVEVHARRADGTACPPVRGRALIDPGADRSAFDSAALECAAPAGSYWAQGVTSESVELPMYDVTLVLPGTSIEPVVVEHAAGTPHLASQGLVGLVGRDVLQHGALAYDGLSGTYALSLPGGTHTARASGAAMPVLAVLGALALGAAGAWLLVPGCRATST